MYRALLSVLKRHASAVCTPHPFERSSLSFVAACFSLFQQTPPLQGVPECCSSVHTPTAVDSRFVLQICSLLISRGGRHGGGGGGGPAEGEGGGDGYWRVLSFVYFAAVSHISAGVSRGRERKRRRRERKPHAQTGTSSPRERCVFQSPRKSLRTGSPVSLSGCTLSL